MKKITIYIPSKDQHGNELHPEDVEIAAHAAANEFTCWFGGSSEHKVVGQYRTELGTKSITEDVTEVYSLTTDDLYAKYYPGVQKLAKWLAGVMEQESVLLTVEDVAKVEFIRG